MNLAVIPARGGSKRIPRKNIKDFFGKPMIWYAINSAKQSGVFDRIIVSTDDEQIAKIAIDLGADVPFLRQPDLSSDHASTAGVIKNAILELQKEGTIYDYVCCIYPCVPLLPPEKISLSWNTMISSNSTSSFPVIKYTAPIERALRITPSGEVQFISPEFKNCRTQDLQPSYYDAGQFYWAKTSLWLQETFLDSSTKPIILNGSKIIDIDTPEDWSRAELLFSLLRKQPADN